MFFGMPLALTSLAAFYPSLGPHKASQPSLEGYPLYSQGLKMMEAEE
jgi:hypothetical protein